MDRAKIAILAIAAAAAALASFTAHPGSAQTGPTEPRVAAAADDDAQLRVRTLRRLRHKPVVAGFSRSGDRLVVSGENFAADTTIAVDGVSVKATTTASRIVCEPGERLGDIVVTTNGERHNVGSLVIETPNAATRRSQRRQHRQHRQHLQSDLAAARRRIEADRKANPRLPDPELAHREWIERREGNRAWRVSATKDVLRHAYDDAFLTAWTTQRELALHMERKAKLVWIMALARKRSAEKLLVRADAALATETLRHQLRLAVLHAAHSLETDHKEVR